MAKIKAGDVIIFSWVLKLQYLGPSIRSHFWMLNINFISLGAFSDLVERIAPKHKNQIYILRAPLWCFDN